MRSRKSLVPILAAVLFVGAAVLYVGFPKGFNDSAGALGSNSSHRAEAAPVQVEVASTSIAASRGSGAATGFQPITMAPEEAYADAISIMQCEQVVADVELDPNMTRAQIRQFQASRIEGLDCSSLDSPYTAQQLAKYAAERGNVQAQIDYSAIAAPMFEEEANALDPALIAQFKHDSLRFLHMAAASGNRDAFSRLSSSYRQGLFSDQDLIKAYAYAYAAHRLAPSGLTQKLLDRYGVELSADELLRAQKLGRSLILR